eukprot:519555-Pyramimonas_sp.AAC.1
MSFIADRVRPSASACRQVHGHPTATHWRERRDSTGWFASSASDGIPVAPGEPVQDVKDFL